jgi:hypothetical protein
MDGNVTIEHVLLMEKFRVITLRLERVVDSPLSGGAGPYHQRNPRNDCGEFGAPQASLSL